MMDPAVYTIKDVAKLLQCSESSVNNLRERGILREVKGLPGVRFNKKEVEALVGIVDEYSPLQYCFKMGGVHMDYWIHGEPRNR